MSTALEIIQDASTAAGLTSPSTIENTSDTQTLGMLSLLNRIAKNIHRDFLWQALIKQTSFTTDGSTEYEISSAPISIDDFTNLTTPFLYNRTENRAIIGQNDNSYQITQMYNVTQSRFRFRIIQGKIQFDVAIPSGQDIHFEYKTKNFVEQDNSPSANTFKDKFDKNTDTTFLDDELLIKGLIWKFLSNQGLSYDEEFREYQEYLSKLKDQDKDLRVIDMNKNYGYRYRFPSTYRNIPDTW
jgi:hypothetical protein